MCTRWNIPELATVQEDSIQVRTDLLIVYINKTLFIVFLKGVILLTLHVDSFSAITFNMFPERNA